jgi:hypothetical protein
MILDGDFGRTPREVIESIREAPFFDASGAAHRRTFAAFRPNPELFYRIDKYTKENHPS